LTVSIVHKSVPKATPNGPRKRAEFTSCPISTTTLVVTAEGELDACNAHALADYVESSLGSSTRLIVDLRDLQFFGTSGFSVLHNVNVACSRRGTNWVVIPGGEVDRLLRICDPGGGLPVAKSLETAIAAVVRGPRRHLRMLPRA
jgi:anti-anti-sigma factor